MADKILLESEAKDILRKWSVPVPRGAAIKTVDEAISSAEATGYPVVLKVMSRGILHKSDAGGVKTGLRDRGDVERAWAEISCAVKKSSPSAVVEGFLIEEMAPSGVEVIVGALRDEQFGPTVMFGTGGIAVEVMKDVSFSLAPLKEEEAFEMMREVRGYPLLTGLRGRTPCDVDALAGVIVKVSRVIASTEGLKEFEINPLIVYGKGVMAVDARAIFSFPRPDRSAG
ncbi:MAG: acetate--CoA ligase family protein [Deltaproteobacteria bacterium]|nr:acetate--CoA ligase family protein [Deltaproteobacteria bacterium]